MVVVARLDGLGAFLETTLAQVVWGGAGCAVMEHEAVAFDGCAGAADLRVVRREPFSRSANFVVRVATFPHQLGRCGSLVAVVGVWQLPGGV